jgi:hypothetical protein
MARNIAPHEAWVVEALTCLATSCMPQHQLDAVSLLPCLML